MKSCRVAVGLSATLSGAVARNPASKCEPIVFRSNAEGSLRVDLSTRLAIVELVVELIGRRPRRSTIAGSWMRSRDVNLGPTGRGRKTLVMRQNN